MKIDSPVKIWRKQKQMHKLLGKLGRVILWTKIYNPSVRFLSEAPYFVVLVKMENGSFKIGQLTDWNEKNLKKGMKVKLVFRRIGKAKAEEVINYGLKFKVI